MRVQCSSVDEFIENLKAEDGVFQDVVRVSTSRVPFDGDKHEAAIFDVTIQMSAVVLVDHESQYLLESGEYCGRDYVDASKELVGSDKARDLINKLRSFCKERGWSTRPGVITL